MIPTPSIVVMITSKSIVWIFGALFRIILLILLVGGARREDLFSIAPIELVWWRLVRSVLIAPISAKNMHHSRTTCAAVWPFVSNCAAV